MWTVYKREIIAREKADKDFLKNYYKRNKALHEEQHGGGAKDSDKEISNVAKQQDSLDDWPVELDSDEEAPEGMVANGLVDEQFKV